MLNRNPNRHPNDYQICSASRSYRCPHCGGFIKSNFFEKIHGVKIDTPIKRCRKCQNYYLDIYNNEWCVSSTKYKKDNYFAPWLLFLVEIYLFELASDLFSVTWALILCFIYLLLHIPIRFVLSEFASNRAKEKSAERLAKNPEYPQILADMGYGSKMDETYQALMKYPPQKITVKEVLKEAVTFD